MTVRGEDGLVPFLPGEMGVPHLAPNIPGGAEGVGAAPPARLVIAKLARHVAPFSGAAHLAVAEPDRMQRAFDLVLPILDELEQAGMVGGQIVVLRDKGFQNRRLVGQSGKDLCGGQPVAL